MSNTLENKLKFAFSGHESFQCRNLWLKKGYDFVVQGNSFNSPEAVSLLGVGKNMVASIRFWLKAFDLLDNVDSLTPFAHKMFSDEGWDPFLEDFGSLWLLHYKIVKKAFASTYSIVFNELRKERIEFNKSHFLSIVRRKIEANSSNSFNEKTLAEDFSVFIKMYVNSEAQMKDKEESFSGLLADLDLIKAFYRGKDELFVIENTEKEEIPDDIILFCILDNLDKGVSVSLNSLEKDANNIGSIFAMNSEGILNKIENLQSNRNNIVFSDVAGVKEIQFKKILDSFKILDRYYANQV